MTESAGDRKWTESDASECQEAEASRWMTSQWMIVQAQVHSEQRKRRRRTVVSPSSESPRDLGDESDVDADGVCADGVGGGEREEEQGTAASLTMTTAGRSGE